MNQVLAGWGVSLLLFIAGVGIPSGKVYAPEFVKAEAMSESASKEIDAKNAISTSVDRIPQPKPIVQIQFKWGDVSWLPQLATEAGWPAETHEQLAQIVLRESGGCPNRRGGDMVDENCSVTGVSEWNHRSDTGLLQINGVNYNPKRNKWAIACRQLNICTQEPLLDPVTNLKVGYLLYQADGWNPWDPCAWGEEWAHRCNKKNP